MPPKEMKHNSSPGYWYDELKPIIIKIIWGNPLRKFFSFVFVTGVGMFSYRTIEEIVLLHILGVTLPPNSESQPENDYLTPAIGIALILVSIIAHIAIYKSEKKEEKIQKQRLISQKASSLAGQLQNIAEAFSDPSTVKPPGYMTEEICKARDIARELRSEWTSSIIADSTFAALCDARIDASGIDPLFGINAISIKTLAKNILNEVELGGLP